jgi:hypothetical protein
VEEVDLIQEVSHHREVQEVVVPVDQEVEFPGDHHQEELIEVDQEEDVILQ